MRTRRIEGKRTNIQLLSHQQPCQDVTDVLDQREVEREVVPEEIVEHEFNTHATILSGDRLRRNRRHPRQPPPIVTLPHSNMSHKHSHGPTKYNTICKTLLTTGVRHPCIYYACTNETCYEAVPSMDTVFVDVYEPSGGGQYNHRVSPYHRKCVPQKLLSFSECHTTS